MSGSCDLFWWKLSWWKSTSWFLSVLFSQRAGTQVDAGQVGWSPEKEQGFSQRELAVWLAPAALECWQGVVSTHIEFSAEVGRGRPQSGASETPPPPWEVGRCEKLLGSWLSQPTVKNHPFHLWGEETSQQVWRRRWGGFAFRSRSLISSGSASVFLCTQVNCRFGFCSNGSFSRHVEAGFWHHRQLESGVFWQGDVLKFYNLWCL